MPPLLRFGQCHHTKSVLSEKKAAISGRSSIGPRSSVRKKPRPERGHWTGLLGGAPKYIGAPANYLCWHRQVCSVSDSPFYLIVPLPHTSRPDPHVLVLDRRSQFASARVALGGLPLQLRCTLWDCRLVLQMQASLFHHRSYFFRTLERTFCHRSCCQRSAA
jgi:hypothetical protein